MVDDLLGIAEVPTVSSIEIGIETDEHLTNGIDHGPDRTRSAPILTLEGFQHESHDAESNKQYVDEEEDPASRIRTGGATSDALGDYMRKARRYHLLSPAEEIGLARRIEVGLAAEHRLATTRFNRSDSAARKLERNLRWLVRDGRWAKEEMITSNIRLVYSIARRYLRPERELIDLVQEGNLGLIRAVEGFDHEQGFRFSTYATWWIRQAITRGIANRGRVIRLPAHLHDEATRVRVAVTRLVEQHGRTPAVADVAEATETAPERVVDLLTHSAMVRSLDELVPALPDERGDTVVVDGMPSIMVRQILVELDEDYLDDLDAQRAMASTRDALLAQLGTRERDVIARRFGLLGHEVSTLEEIGVMYGVSRERIRQVEKIALTKLRDTVSAQHVVVEIPGTFVGRLPLPSEEELKAISRAPKVKKERAARPYEADTPSATRAISPEAITTKTPAAGSWGKSTQERELVHNPPDRIPGPQVGGNWHVASAEDKILEAERMAARINRELGQPTSRRWTS